MPCPGPDLRPTADADGCKYVRSKGFWSRRQGRSEKALLGPNGGARRGAGESCGPTYVRGVVLGWGWRLTAWRAVVAGTERNKRKYLAFWNCFTIRRKTGLQMCGLVSSNPQRTKTDSTKLNACAWCPTHGRRTSSDPQMAA